MSRPSIPPEEVKVLDTNASYLGVRTINLMENAGAAVAKYVLSIAKPGSKVAVLCGKGNNGGDGFVAARHLAKQVHTDLFLIEPEQDISSDIARMNLDSARESFRPLQTLDTRNYDIIVDAMLGVGLQGSPRGPYRRYIKELNDSKARVVSVDVPSGWASDLSVRPDTTVTFHAPKVGMNSRNSGKIVVADIGIPSDAETYCGPGDFTLVPRRRKDSHKGDSGRVLVIGGGPYTGAPAFTGMAAMRSGVDLTYVATPEASATAVSIYSPNYIVRPLEGEIFRDDHVKELVQFSKGMDVVAIGPGLGNAPETVSAIQSFIKAVDKPLVVDADAIGACGAEPGILKRKSGVLTPHAGEFKKLTGKTLPPEDLDKRRALVREAAARLRMTILLKGPVDVISDGTYI